MGARQVGKTTPAKAFATGLASDPTVGIYLDLDSPQDQAILSNASAFFEANRHRLVVLDEIQNQSEILQLLRGEIEADRRPGRFLILGSASFKLLKLSFYRTAADTEIDAVVEMGQRKIGFEARFSSAP